MDKRARLNEAIRAPELRVIDADGSQIGVISRQEALERARLAGLDLVEISPQANPPVAKIVDWGKYQYQKLKEQQKSRKKQKSSELKQIRFGLKIGQHDLDVKLKKIREFLEEGNKVRITAFFRGREMAHQDLGYKQLERVYNQISDVAVIDMKPTLAGKQLSMTVRSGHAKTTDPQRGQEADQEDSDG